LEAELVMVSNQLLASAAAAEAEDTPRGETRAPRLSLIAPIMPMAAQAPPEMTPEMAGEMPPDITLRSHQGVE
jgi:hypothetical protein